MPEWSQIAAKSLVWPQSLICSAKLYKALAKGHSGSAKRPFTQPKAFRLGQTAYGPSQKLGHAIKGLCGRAKVYVSRFSPCRSYAYYIWTTDMDSRPRTRPIYPQILTLLTIIYPQKRFSSGWAQSEDSPSPHVIDYSLSSNPSQPTNAIGLP